MLHRDYWEANEDEYVEEMSINKLEKELEECHECGFVMGTHRLFCPANPMFNFEDHTVRGIGHG